MTARRGYHAAGTMVRGVVLLSALSMHYLVQGALLTSPESRQPVAHLGAANCDTALPAGQRHFLHVDDLSSSEVREVMELAKQIKAILKDGGSYKPFDGQTLAMIFTKPSCRTRVSFESGYWRLGGHALCLGSEVGIGTREATKDVSRVLASMNDMIMARLYGHKDILELAEFSKVPVINGLTNYNHPCQIIADALTVEEVMPDGTIEGKKVVYVGDGNNIVHSWLELAIRVPFHFVCACPPGYEPDRDLVNRVNAEGLGSCEVVVGDPMTAVKGADVIYADVWASMQQKEEASAREKVFEPYQVNEKLMAATGKKGTIFLHCLPAERGREVTDGVMEGPQSHVFRQSENRMHAQNAIMVFCAGVERPS
jgi:ornithine carbamoyltransferase